MKKWHFIVLAVLVVGVVVFFRRYIPFIPSEANVVLDGYQNSIMATVSNPLAATGILTSTTAGLSYGLKEYGKVKQTLVTNKENAQQIINTQASDFQSQLNKTTETFNAEKEKLSNDYAMQKQELDSTRTSLDKTNEDFRAQSSDLLKVKDDNTFLKQQIADLQSTVDEQNIALANNKKVTLE